MSETIKLDDDRLVTVVPAGSPTVMFSQNDAEMDQRAREAVKSAIHRAKTCKKPIARYDRANQRAYLETVDGRRIYV